MNKVEYEGVIVKIPNPTIFFVFFAGFFGGFDELVESFDFPPQRPRLFSLLALFLAAFVLRSRHFAHGLAEQLGGVYLGAFVIVVVPHVMLLVIVLSLQILNTSRLQIRVQNL